MTVTIGLKRYQLRRDLKIMSVTTGLTIPITIGFQNIIPSKTGLNRVLITIGFKKMCLLQLDFKGYQ